MPRFDLLDEYTCVLLPNHARSEPSRAASLPDVNAPSRRTNVRWGHWMAAAGGFAALVIAVTASRLFG